MKRGRDCNVGKEKGYNSISLMLHYFRDMTREDQVSNLASFFDFVCVRKVAYDV